jgi:predicted DNA-binding protein
MDRKTSIQISMETRDRLYKLKFRKTYDEFLKELCDLYEEHSEME